MPAKVTPLAVERYALHLSFGKAVYEKLEHARALLGHRIPSGDLEAVLEAVLDLAIGRLERQKFAATERPRRTSGTPTDPRTIPAHVKRAVRGRDEGRCTFTSEDGHRCESRTQLEWDHIVPLARGGRATVDNIRLRCRPHNALEAERTFGAGFMEHKRQEARRATGGGS